MSALERHALQVRGPAHCRLVFQDGESCPASRAAGWLEHRGYGHVQALDFDSGPAVQLLGQALTGKGHAIAAASAGVYAAAILGTLQALEEYGLPAVALAAAGSAVLPAGLLACGKLGAASAIFQELANPMLWKRSSRPEAGLYDPVPLDNFLVGALQGLEIPPRPALRRGIAFAFGGRGRGAPHCQAARRGAGRHRASGHAAASDP